MTLDLTDCRENDPFPDETGRQAAVDRLLPARLRLNFALDQLVREAADSYATMASAISIIDRDQQIFIARRGIDLWGTSRQASFCAVALQRPGEALVVPDARDDPRFARNPSVLSAPHVRFYAGMTIADAAGHALGALCVFDSAPRYGDVDLAPLISLATLAERIIAG